VTKFVTSVTVLEVAIWNMDKVNVIKKTKQGKKTGIKEIFLHEFPTKGWSRSGFHGKLMHEWVSTETTGCGKKYPLRFLEVSQQSLGI